MNFEFFVFIVFMSIVSFIVAFLAYAMVLRFMGKEGTASKVAQVILVPACVVFFDFITFTVPSEYRYIVGSLPILAVGLMFLYLRFFKGEAVGMAEVTPMEAAKKLEVEPKKFSKKSERIHAARKKRGRE